MHAELHCVDVGRRADLYNRQYHPDEKQKLSELEKGKSADERQRLEDAACYLVHCADQMSDGNPAKQAAVDSENRGALDTTQQGELASTGLFKYNSIVDGGLDLASRGWDWTGPGVVRGAKNFFDGGAADSASQFVDLMTGDAQNKISESPAALVVQGIANGLSAVGGIEGGGPTASPGLQLADSAAGQAAAPSQGVAGQVPENATLASGGNNNRLPIPEKVTADNGLQVESNPKHTPDMPGNRPNAGTEPSDSLDLFNSSIPSGDKTRYAIDSDGNINRFYSDGNGVYHWTGSTGDARSPLDVSSIPIDIKRALGFKGR